MAIGSGIHRLSDPVGLKNVAGETINPARDESLQTILDAMASQRDGGSQLLVGTRRNQVEARFFEHDPNNILAVQVTGTGSITQDVTEGNGKFGTGTTAGSTFQASMREVPRYASHFPNYWVYTAAFPVVTGSGKIEKGPRDATTGYFTRRNKDGLFIVHFRDGVDTETIQVTDENGDLVTSTTVGYADGVANGDLALLYKRDDVVEKPVFENEQVYLWTQLWLGSGVTSLLLYHPDSNERPEALVAVHHFKHTNLDTRPSTSTPNLPVDVRGENGDTGEDLVVTSGCWAAGNTSPGVLPFESIVNTSATGDGDPAPTVATPFRGAYVSTIHHRHAVILLEADQSGTLTVFYSHDAAPGSDRQDTFEYDTADGAVIIPVSTPLEFLKVDFDPDVDTTTFEVRTVLRNDPIPVGTQKLKAQMDKNTDAVPTKAALFAFDDNQTKPMPGDPTLGIKVDDLHSLIASIKADNPPITNPIIRKDFDFAGGAIYKGYATAGSDRSSGKAWTILRTTLVNGLPQEDGVAVGVNWDDRAGETYTGSVA